MWDDAKTMAGRVRLALSYLFGPDPYLDPYLARSRAEPEDPSTDESPSPRRRPNRKFTNATKNHLEKGLLALRRRLRVPEVFYDSGVVRRDGAKQALGLAFAAASVTAAMPAISGAAKRQQADHEWRLEAAEMVRAMRLAQTTGDSPVLAAREGLSPSVVRALDHAIEAHERDLAGQRFAAVTQDRQSIAAYQSFTPVHFERAQRRAEDQQCLAEAVYYEARGEAFIGQLAVAEVVANRVADPRYPDTFCGVVYQGSHRVTGCQFTFTCDGALAKRPYGEAWARAQEVATHVLVGFHQPVTRGSTHYHTTEVNPRWAPTLTSTRQIGVHKFYRWEEQPVIRYEASLHIPPAVEPVSFSAAAPTRAALR